MNDIPMIKKASIGVTTANAHPNIKKVAQFVAKKEYGDGFVEAIKKYTALFSCSKAVDDNIIFDIFYSFKWDDKKLVIL